MSDIRAVTYSDAVDVTPSDTANIDPPFSGLEAKTTAGLVTVTTIDGTKTAVYLLQGVVKPLAVKRVWATGLGAAGIVGYRAPSVRGA